MQTISLIGVPSSAGTHVRGAEIGADALRAAGITKALRSLSLPVIDQGNLSGPPMQYQDEPAVPSPLKDLEVVYTWNHIVFETITQTLARGHFPLMLGGDHSLAIGSISAVANHCRATNKKLLVLWFDAHTDANTPEISPSGNIHGMPIACLLNYGPDRLTRLWNQPSGEHVSSTKANAPTQPAAIKSTELCFVGVRSVDHEEKQFVQQLGLRILDMRFINEFGIHRAIKQALADVDSNTHIHLSFDLDCLDPTIAPGVSVPEAGGLTYREMQLCLETIYETGRLGSIDLVELNPTQDIRNMTATLAIDLLQSALGKSSLLRRRE